MALIDIGISESDLTNNAIADFGTAIQVEYCERTEDWRGNFTEAFSGTKAITAVFHIRNKTKVRTDEGIMELAPAFLMTKITDNVGTNARITVGTGTAWRVFNVNNRHGVYNFSDLYSWEDD